MKFNALVYIIIGFVIGLGAAIAYQAIRPAPDYTVTPEQYQAILHKERPCPYYERWETTDPDCMPTDPCCGVRQ